MTMLELKLNLSDEIVERLQSEAERRNLPVDKLVSEAVEYYLEEDEDVEYEDEDEAVILESLREGLIDIVAGRTYPVDELFHKSRKARSFNAD